MSVMMSPHPSQQHQYYISSYPVDQLQRQQSYSTGLFGGLDTQFLESTPLPIPNSMSGLPTLSPEFPLDFEVFVDESGVQTPQSDSSQTSEYEQEYYLQPTVQQIQQQSHQQYHTQQRVHECHRNSVSSNSSEASSPSSPQSPQSLSPVSESSPTSSLPTPPTATGASPSLLAILNTPYIPLARRKNPASKTAAATASKQVLSKRRAAAAAGLPFEDESDENMMMFPMFDSNGNKLNKKQRNKLSAIAYRKRRKLYLDGLEENLAGVEEKLEQEQIKNKELQEQFDHVKTLIIASNDIKTGGSSSTSTTLDSNDASKFMLSMLSSYLLSNPAELKSAISTSSAHAHGDGGALSCASSSASICSSPLPTATSSSSVVKVKSEFDGDRRLDYVHFLPSCSDDASASLSLHAYSPLVRLVGEEQAQSALRSLASGLLFHISSAGVQNSNNTNTTNHFSQQVQFSAL